MEKVLYLLRVLILAFVFYYRARFFPLSFLFFKRQKSIKNAFAESWGATKRTQWYSIVFYLQLFVLSIVTSRIILFLMAKSLPFLKMLLPHSLDTGPTYVILFALTIIIVGGLLSTINIIAFGFFLKKHWTALPYKEAIREEN